MGILLTPECYEEYCVKHNFFHSGCFASALSKLLGFMIIVGCSILKIPQIIKVYQNKSAEGINILSIVLEIVTNTIHMAYSFWKGFPFLQWGETMFLVLQTVTIGILVLHYESTNKKAAALGISYFIFTWIFMGGYIPRDVLWRLKSVNILIYLMSKSIQIYTNYKNGHTGQLSAISSNLLFLKGLARIFTSIQETGDMITILGNSVAATANGIIAGQIWYYWDDTKNKSD